MYTGTDNISREQQKLLEKARERIHPSEAFEILYRLVRDNDICKGREELHPDWFPIFEQYRESLRRYAPEEIIEKIDLFFKKFPGFDKSLTEIDPQSLKVSFLLGAGASKPDPPLCQ